MGVAAAVLTSACGLSGEDPGPSVILLVGDGMGAAHREAARLDQVGPGGELAMGSLSVSGRQSTIPDDPATDVTDSAAAATAWATGETTVNAAISVDPEGEPLVRLGTEAAEAGRSTGLVTTSQVTDATPAAFFSSTPDREWQDDIASQYLAGTGPDVVLGGGADVWTADLLDEAADAGVEVVTDADGLADANGNRVLGLFADGPLYEDPDPEVSLADLTRAALDVLSEDEDGFFLLVEEEGVDAAAHENESEDLLAAMRSLEEAVQVALDHAAEHPDTLVVVAGDHETGGLSVVEGPTVTGEVLDDDGPFPVADDDGEFSLGWTTTDHTATPTVVTAEGPGSDRLGGSYPNTRLHEVMRDVLLGGGQP